jgi:exonuclease SbcC
MAHYTVVGCELENGEHVFLQNDVVIPKEALAASPFDIVCLGHIHKAQEVPGCGRPTYYCGPVNGITFNEEGQEKGFWIHDINTWESRFVTTPYRPFLTINVDFREVTDINECIRQEIAGIYPHGALLQCDATGKIVRFHYQCTEEQKKQISHKAIEEALKTAAAFYVHEIKPIQVVTELQKQGMSETEGPLENLTTWLLAEGFTAEEVVAIVDLARPIVDTVSAKMPTGKLSGVFEPVSLEVKNYRSYREESFDFSRINFATVNGPNGVGKSAFFMDAMSDCLFEETREGEITGWISNGTDIKSGSITFEFKMGDSNWRVVRTRAKSGKITLALQEIINNEWADKGGTTTKETQAKIVDLLGMDAMTFRCCALIMQDNYGLFLEADRGDRMEVLANILGLNVYEQLSDLAKVKVTDVNRTLELKKTKIAELTQKLTVKPTLEEELVQVKQEIISANTDIEDKEKQLFDAQEIVKCLERKQARAEEVGKQIKSIGDENDSKTKEIVLLRERIANQQKILDAEPTILAKVKELEEVKGQVNTIQAKLPQVQELQSRQVQTKSDLSKTQEDKQLLDNRVNVLEKELAGREEYERAAREYQVAMDDLNAHDNKAKQHADIVKEIVGFEQPLDTLINESSNKNVALNNCADRVRILADSKCVDIEKSQCNFLADAQAAKAQIPKLEEEINEIAERQKPLKNQILALEEKLIAIGYDSDAHYETKRLVEALRPKSEKAAQLASKTELLDTLNKQLEQYSERIQTLTNSLTETGLALDTLLKEIEPLATLEAKLPILQKWADGKEKLPVAREIIKASNETISKSEQEIADKQTIYAALTLELDEIKKEVEILPATIERVGELRRDTSLLKTGVNELHTRSGGLESKLQSLGLDEDELSRLSIEMKPTAVMLLQYQTLLKAFGFDGIPFNIVRSVVPELSNMANEILSQMTGGKMSLEMRTERIQKSSKKEVNALEIWVIDYIRGSLPYKSRSGGQKVKAALSVAFALADLKARRAGIQLGMMFVDEPPFLDDDGVDAYCDALELLSQRYVNMRVLAISHDPRMKARFPQQIEVEDMGEAGSKVRMAA